MFTIKESMRMSFCSICTELGIFEENQASIVAADDLRYGDVNSPSVDFIIDSRYIMVQYYIILHTAQQHQKQNFSLTKDIHISP